MAYHDPAQDAYVWLGVVTNALGWLTASNEVIYFNCLVGLSGSICYHITRWGFQEDLLLDEAPPAPEQFGLSAATRLELVTELAPHTPAAVVKEQVLRPQGHSRPSSNGGGAERKPHQPADGSADIAL